MILFRRKKKAAPKAKKPARKKKAKKTKAKKVKKVRKVAKKAPVVSKSKEIQIGAVTHYFPHVKAGALVIKNGTLSVGDTIHIKGHTTDFKQKIKSLQIDRVPVETGSKGDEVGILVKSRVRINDTVYKVKS